MDDHECSECGNGCNHDPEDQTVILTLEDGSELECSILGIFDVDDRSYIALLPHDDEEVIIYSYEQEGENISFGYIETEEYDKVFDAFSEIFESFDEKFTN